MSTNTRHTRRLTATGWDQQTNEVLLSIASTIAAVANVVFFPGDVQDFHDAMYAGAYSEFASYSYESVAATLAQKFGNDTNVWVIRPNELAYNTYACYTSFVASTKHGAALSYTHTGTAVPHLMALMENVQAQLQQEHDISLELPIHLVGFSKGGIVLNQIATEATRWKAGLFSNFDTPDNNNNNNNNEVETLVSSADQRFFSRLSSIHWVDSGNGSRYGAVPTDERTLSALYALRPLTLCVHVTPYQFDAPDRRWIRSEILQFIGTMIYFDFHVHLLRYHEHTIASLRTHFQILNDMALPQAYSTKTGEPHSPEVTVQPFHFQSRSVG
ncbi:hypothetical protein Poli38472_000971 [Pythium oligandrum]|uniref:Uncharacterized protein n=1 Tax=Pythium oligandrum TaxID=41045 RepID=A0A8K1FHE5_PYTOL|nr:hypothetical protein Poli38472_000971 [Pythium oligandrum]|eukprot:TMW60929.1 hypothetical protein Poli38472_000971 [Pythium oligandrum]